LCRTAIGLAPRRQVRIIFNNRFAFELCRKHCAQANVAPLLQGAKGKNDSVIHIDDSGDSHDKPQEVFFRLPLFAQQLPNLLADPGADSGGRRGPPVERNACPSQFTSVQVGKQEMEKAGADLDASHAASLSLESQNVGRPASG
jgi:hypothetical protein